MNLIPKRMIALIWSSVWLVAVPMNAATVTATFTTATTVPVTAAGYTATGNTVDFTLNFAPPVGTNLTVVKNTGLGFISGQFSNLAHGQFVTLTYNKAAYKFVANYYGGTGNDLVLHWARNKIYAWGQNSSGQLGNGTTTHSNVPVAVAANGILAGKTVTAIALGSWASLALCADGTLATWGDNALITGDSNVPVAFPPTGALAAKTVVAIAAGEQYQLALCADGTLAAWGDNSSGQLGNATNNFASTPVAVSTTGVLAGKTVVAIAAGEWHCLALCADGTLAAWGNNADGQLGNGSTTNSNVPVAVTIPPFLAGKTVTAIAAGHDHCMALYSDSTIAAWGSNTFGSLGNGTNTRSSVPVAVKTSGILSGKTVTGIATGGYGHCLARCSDGTLAAWGYNQYGELGNGTTTYTNEPVAVSTTPLLSGKTITTLAAGYCYSMACCSDGAIAAWGFNNYGVLGNGNFANSKIPVAVTTSTLGSGERFTTVAGSVMANHALALAAVPLSNISTLASLALSPGFLDGTFAAATTSYTARVPHGTPSVSVTPTVTDADATVTVNGVTLASGTTSPPVALAPGNKTLTITVTAQDGTSTSYTVTVWEDSGLVTASYTSATMVPVTATGYVAAGNTVDFTLNFAPPTGTDLTVVNNTGMGFIQGVFANLAHGQTVNLTYGGVTYPFVANYCGGTGNDLVLQWANTRLLAWGSNATGELGDASATPNSLPEAVNSSGVLAGKLVVATAAGYGHSVALCADGTVAAWGYNSFGQLGNGSNADSSVPVQVNMGGALAGKTVISVAAGYGHSMALCADGTIATWGYNYYGLLGNASGTDSNVPVLVNREGVLAGTTVIAVAAGTFHNLALCADGTVAAWGYNSSGQLGNGTTTSSSIPVAVRPTGVLSGKTVSAIAGGNSFSLALCTDGTAAAWGYNSSGQLGNNSTTSSNLPVAVDMAGVLAGKTIIGLAAGASHSLVLCADATVAAWGSNYYGQLGNKSTTNRSAPLLVDRTGVLAGKLVSSIAAGGQYSHAVCADGSMASWGYNNNGQLGNGTTTDATAPVLVSTSTLRNGERIIAGRAGNAAGHTLALVAAVPPPMATTLAATGIIDTAVTLNGSVNAQSASTTVSFEYGLTTSYGATVSATPASATGVTTAAASAVVSGLLAGSTYHYRIVATSGGGTVTGGDLTFTTTTFASLTSLRLSSGTLLPSFASINSSYVASVPYGTSSIRITPVCLDPSSSVSVNGSAVASGSDSNPFNLAVGNNLITTMVTAADGSNTQTYTVSVTRLPQTFTFNSATDVPVTVSDFLATGNPASFALNFLPLPGARLTVVKNTGQNPIQGTFDNLTQGQVVTLTYGGVNYPLVANYFGGTGNDLELQWANTRLLAWGDNSNGQLGNNSIANSSVAVPVAMAGALAGKTVVSIATGSDNCLALCADGSLAAWGRNAEGQLGNNSTIQSKIPVPVNQSGVLAGKTVIAIAAGGSQGLALCTDGTLATWGYNYDGSLGNNSPLQCNVPVLVNQTGVLAGRKIVAMAAGGSHSLVLCSDGTLAAWGSNYFGQLGNNSKTNGMVPVLVDQTGTLAGKMVIAVAAGSAHSLALCSDGTVASWGYNSNGQLGNNSSTISTTPVPVDRSGVLSGKTVTAIAAGNFHSFAQCSDGTLAAWGAGGILGDNTSTSSNVPVKVVDTGVLSGRTVVTTSAGVFHNLALCADGALAAWGNNSSGQLGDNSTSDRTAPVLANTSALTTGERFMTVMGGYAHSLALVVSPPAPLTTTVGATGITDTAATLHGNVNPNGSDSTVTFEFGLTDSYGSSIRATPPSLAGTTTTTAATANPKGLLSGTTYHYRVVATSAGGTVNGEDMTFTTTTFATLSSLTLSSGTLLPTFTSINTGYVATVPFPNDTIRVTPVCAYAPSSITVNDIAVTSANASAPISLAMGNNLIRTVVTAGDGSNTQTYSVIVTRLPEAFTFNSATDVPVTVSGFSATGNSATFALNHAPTPGTILTVVDNTGPNPIRGTFDNLTQGCAVQLTHEGITYAFVANYFGGDGNDLVLQWSNTRLLAWGSNTSGQIGNNSTTNSIVAVPVDMTGVLNNKTILMAAAGSSHSLVLCSDGTLAAWGDNTSGQLGNHSTTSSAIPVLVDQTGVLAGKTVTMISAGGIFSIAMCSDGTLVSWGYNNEGQLGNNSRNSSTVPVLVDQTGVLAGRTVTAVTAGGAHCLALCRDGALAAWGYNYDGSLGNNSTTNSSVPVLVNQTGVLAGKTVVAVVAANGHNLALSSDGTLTAWGYNNTGQLGNDSTTTSIVPVSVNQKGVFAGKTIIGLDAGGTHSLTLCSDGTMAAWGYNAYGQLGNNNTVNASAPVLVNQTGVLAGKVATSVSAGSSHNLALCSDGTLVAWGYNASGQLGNNSTTSSSVPVGIILNGLVTGSRFVAMAAGFSHNLALAAIPLQTATSQIATAITGTSATLNGRVNANGNAATVAFEYGLTPSYGNTLAGSPSNIAGGSDTSVSAGISGLTPGTIYHYRVVASCYGGIARSADMTFTTLSNNAWLAVLSLNAGALVPDFTKTTVSYFATVPYATDGVTVTPITDHQGASARVEGVPVASGAASSVLPLAVGNNTLTVVVTAEDGIATKTYTVTVTRLPQEFVFNSASDVPVTANGFSTGGYPATVVLGYLPVPGTILTMVNNTGLGFIYGTFRNLAQGQRIGLVFDGKTYHFVANYFGGTGNDLVLQWADTMMAAWGANNYGQLGDASATRRLVPTPVAATGVLSGKTIVAVAGGYLHSLALCSDGTLAAWGYNVYGQLGNNGSAPSNVPMAVDRSGVLAGKTVIAISAGPFHNLALCSDGSIAAWGYNNYGQLGTGDKVTRRVPALVPAVGALAGKQVVAVAAAAYHSFALCSDGTLAAWGYNDEGELGDGGVSNSTIPVAVDATGVLAGKRIASIAAGQYHTLARCTAGTLVSWGYNNRGQLGNGMTASSKVPVDITAAGALAGRTVVAIRASGAHSLALCGDGSLAAWGWNQKGQLGAGGITQSPLPLPVDMAGSAITQIAVGSLHSMVLRADGSIAAWGDNAYGQLGNDSTTGSAVPVAVDLSSLETGARCMFAASGSAALHSLVVLGLPAHDRTNNVTTLWTQGADPGDADHDGIADIIEYAFGLTGSNIQNQLPQPQRIADHLVMRFTQPGGVAGITYGAEWSTTLQPGSWVEVPDTGTDGEHLFSVPANEPRMFLRLKVSSQ